jgi:glycosyltransferase involved in cell wall biosynthesis
MTERPRLLVLASTYPRWANDSEPGFVHELARRLVADFEVVVLCPHAPGAARREQLDGVDVRRYRYAPMSWQTLVNDGGVVANLKRNGWKWLLVPGFLLAQVWAARRIMRTERVAVVHAHWIIPQGVVARLALVGRRQMGLLLTSHGADLHALRGRLSMALKRWVVRRANAFTVVSAAMVDKLAALGADPATIAVAPMGVDFERRFAPSMDAERSSTELLFVGRLVEKKGLRVVLAALPEVRRRLGAVRLTVVGFGPEEAALRKQAMDLQLGDCVDFVGAVPPDRLASYYQRAALFVAPFVRADDGDEEGLGLVVVEAIACLCPVLVSDLPATRDVLSEGLPAGDVRAWVEGICAELSVDPLLLKVRAVQRREALLERMSWSPVAAGYAQRLRALLRAVPDHQR